MLLKAALQGTADNRTGACAHAKQRWPAKRRKRSQLWGLHCARFPAFYTVFYTRLYCWGRLGKGVPGVPLYFSLQPPAHL